jgi:hypothetical protein
VTTPTISERDWQRTVLDLAKLYRWTVLHLHDSRRVVVVGDGEPVAVGDKDIAGLPDLLLIRDRVVWAELKAPGGRLRPKQKRILEALRQAGQEVYVWWPQHLDEAREVLAPASEPKRWALRDDGMRGRL